MKRYLLKHVPTGKYFEHSEGMDFLVNRDEVEVYHRDKLELAQILKAYSEGYVSAIDEMTGDEFNYSDLEIEEVIF